MFIRQKGRPRFPLCVYNLSSVVSASMLMQYKPGIANILLTALYLTLLFLASDTSGPPYCPTNQRGWHSRPGKIISVRVHECERERHVVNIFILLDSE